MNRQPNVSDEQMLDAHSFIIGIIHAQLGIPSATESETYLASFGEEYERGERETANERPF